MPQKIWRKYGRQTQSSCISHARQKWHAPIDPHDDISYYLQLYTNKIDKNFVIHNVTLLGRLFYLSFSIYIYFHNGISGRMDRELYYRWTLARATGFQNSFFWGGVRSVVVCLLSMMRGIWPSLSFFYDYFPTVLFRWHLKSKLTGGLPLASVEIEHPSLSDARIITNQQQHRRSRNVMLSNHARTHPDVALPIVWLGPRACTSVYVLGSSLPSADGRYARMSSRDFSIPFERQLSTYCSGTDFDGPFLSFLFFLSFFLFFFVTSWADCVTFRLSTAFSLFSWVALFWPPFFPVAGNPLGNRCSHLVSLLFLLVVSLGRLFLPPAITRRRRRRPDQFWE